MVGAVPDKGPLTSPVEMAETGGVVSIPSLTKRWAGVFGRRPFAFFGHIGDKSLPYDKAYI